MAPRPLLLTVSVSIHVSDLSTSSFLSISLYCLTVVAAVMAAVTFLCGSTSSSPSPAATEKKLLWKLSRNVSAKAHLMAKKMSWKRTTSYSDTITGGDEEDAEVWRKAIILGDRCRQLDFSGRISYDCEGNLVPSLPSSPPPPSHGATETKSSSNKHGL